MTTMIPLGNRVLVKRDDPEEVTDGGIIIANSQVEKEYLGETRGTVLAVGPEAWDYEGGEASRCEPGDKILFARYSGVSVSSDRRSNVLMNDADIIAKVEDD